MKWSRFGLREKIVATHLLVAAACTIALLAVLILASLVLTPWALEGGPILPAFTLAALVACAGGAAAIGCAHWLYRQIMATVGRATTVVQRLAQGEYRRDSPPIKQATVSRNADLDGLAAALDDLSLSLDAAEQRRRDAYEEI